MLFRISAMPPAPSPGLPSRKSPDCWQMKRKGVEDRHGAGCTPATSFADIDHSLVPARARLVADGPIAALVAVGVTLVTVGGTVGVTSSSARSSSAIVAISAPTAVVGSGMATCAIAPAAIECIPAAETSASRNAAQAAADIAGRNTATEIAAAGRPATGRPAMGKAGSGRASTGRASTGRASRRRPPRGGPPIPGEAVELA